MHKPEESLVLGECIDGVNASKYVHSDNHVQRTGSKTRPYLL